MSSLRDLVIFDADGVLLSWLRGVADYLESKGLSIDHLDFSQGVSYTFGEIFKCNDRLGYAKYQEFLNSEYSAKFKVHFEGSVEVMARLHQKYDICVVSCFGEDPLLQSKREANLREVFGDIFISVICIDLGQSKADVLSFIKDNYGRKVVAFIDDSEKHVKEGEAVGINSFQLIGDAEPVNNGLKHLRNFDDIEALLL